MTDLEIFHNAPEGASGAELGAYLDGACGGDVELRARVEALMAVGDGEDDYLDEVAVKGGGEGEGTVIGKYKLLQEIGVGGFGVVYMAEQLRPVKRRVALKIIKLGMDTKQVVARFEVERQALAMMDHPNIAKVFDAGATETGRPYFVMELVRGIPVTRFCDEQKLGAEARLRLFMDVCGAVQHAHQKGVIHRDLKPSNVMVTMHDDKPVPKVIDFGVAKATQSELTEQTLFTRFEQFIGTPAYMSPEQAQMSGLDIDTRSDIYSLGVLLYELLTGTTPFDPETLRSAGYDEIRRIIREEEPPKPSTRTRQTGVQGAADGRQHANPGELRGDLDWIVMKALEKDRARRYGTAGDLAADLQRHLEDEPVLAAAPGVAYRAGKYLRRHRVAIGMVALLAVAAVVSSWQAVRATGARKNEEVVRIKAEASERAGRHRLAEGLFGEGKAGLAVAHLCQLAREDGGDRVAVERLVSALVYRDFPELIARVEAPDGDFRLGTSSTFLRGSGKVLIPVPAVGRLSVWDPERQKTEWMSPGSEMRMGRIAVSRDERYVATQGAGRRVIVYEIESGKEVHSFPCGSTVFWICFSPDGSKLLGGCEGATARVWDLESGAERVYKLEDRNSDILCVDISADGRWAIAGGYFGAYLWDLEVEEPEELKEGETMFKLGHGARVWSVHFSPDGTLAATGSGDHTAQVWSVAGAERGERWGPPLQHRERVRHVVFSPDGSLLASSSMDDTVRIWDVALGQLFVPPLEHDGDVSHVEFDRTGQRVVTSAHGGGSSVRVWDVGSGKAIGAPLPHGEAASKSRFSPDGGAVLVGSLGDGAGLWKVPSARPTGRIQRHRLRDDWINFGGKVSTARYSEDGRQIVTATRYEGSWLWDAESCEPQGGVFGSKNGWGYGAWVALSPDGGAMVTTARGGNCYYWELGEDGRKRWTLEAGKPWYTEFSPAGGKFLFLTSGKGQRIGVWRMEGGVPVSEALPSDTFSNVREDSLSRAHWAHFSPDGRRVIGATEEKVVGVWDLDTMKEPVLLRHSGAIESVAFHPDPESPLVVIGSRDGVGQVWDSVRGRQVFDTPLRHSDAVKSVTYSPDGKLIASASADGTARLWDAVTGEQYGQALHHGSTVSMVRFSPDGRRVATASYDGTARVWDTASGLAVSEAFGHDAWVYSVDFSPDGKRLVSSGLDGTARIWDVAEVPLPAPGWFLQWAESVGGKRIEGGTVEALGWREIETFREGVMGRRGEGFYGELVAWFYAGVEERTITPFTPMTTADYVERELEAGTPESLEEAARVAPLDGVVLARLARNLKERYGESDPGGRRRGEYFAGLAERLLRERLAEDGDDLAAWRGVLEMGAGSAGDYEAAAAAVRRFADGGRVPGERELGDCDGLAAAFEAGGRKEEGLALRVAVVELMRASAPGEAATLVAVRRTAKAALGVVDLAVASEMMEELVEVPGNGVEVAADWMLLAALYLRREDWSGYDELRRRMVARYAGASEAALLERAAKVFFSRPVGGDVEVGETALAMARRSTEIATEAHEWMALCRGMAEYRMGNDEEALVWLAKARESSAPVCRAVAYPYAAMAAFRAGRVEEARGFLGEGRAAVLKLEATWTVDGWHDRVFAWVVLDEAERVVE